MSSEPSPLVPSVFQLEQVTAGANQVVFGSDDEGRLADLSRPVASESVDILYDVRSFMQSTVDPATGAITEPTYSSEGVLHLTLGSAQQ